MTGSLFVSLFLSLWAFDGPMTYIEGADLQCDTPGTRIYLDTEKERLWLAAPTAGVGIEPEITKFLATGEKSLYVEGHTSLYHEEVALFFTVRDLEPALRATLRVVDSQGEESALLRFRCKTITDL